MVFLFVLFGSLLEKAGAGNYFIRVAFALMGHLKGGPAKAAVVSSGMTGLISGSAIANVVTTGTFTIPLMRKVGFSAEKAGAVEVASSTNGQLTPPIMGAVAFLMVEYVGISYLEVIKHAALLALISYIALVYIVHLEAVKAGMKGLPKRKSTATAIQKLTSFLATFLGLVVLTAVVFIFNTELLLIGVDTWYLLLSTIVTALIAMLLFAAGTQGYFLSKSRLWESLALILIAFTLFRPGFWMDMIYPPLKSVPATEIYKIAEGMPEDAQIRIRVVGEDLEERKIDKVVMPPLGPKGDGKERLMNAGLELRFEDGKAFVDNIVFGSTAERQKIDFDYEIPSVQAKADRPPRQLFFIPAMALLAFIIMLQRRRQAVLEAATA